MFSIAAISSGNSHDLMRWSGQNTKYSDRYGVSRYVLRNLDYRERKRYRIVLKYLKTRKEIDQGLWRSDLSKVKDDDWLWLGPREKRGFKIQIRKPGKYYVCSRELIRLRTEDCLVLINKYEMKVKE